MGKIKGSKQKALLPKFTAYMNQETDLISWFFGHKVLPRHKPKRLQTHNRKTQNGNNYYPKGRKTITIP